MRYQVSRPAYRHIGIKYQLIIIPVVTFIFVLSYICWIRASTDLTLLNPDAVISMDFQDVSLKDLLKVFSIQSGLNFIASEAVEDRRITLYLDKVPVKETMDQLFKANNLTYDYDEISNIIIVKDWGKPEIEKITKIFPLKYHSVPGSKVKRQIESNLAAVAPEAAGVVSAGAAGGDIVTAIKEILSEYGKITEDIRTNSLIVTDIPSRFPIIEQVFARLDVPVSQVMLEVEILDVGKDTVDNLGFKFDDNPFTLVLPGGFVRSGAKFYFGAKNDMNKEGNVTLGKTYTQILDFLRTQSDTKYLARPRILTLNNETAEISITKDEIVGYNEKVDIPDQGSPIITREYIRSTDLKLTGEGTGIFLRVTPQINLDTGEITLVINPKSSVTNPSTLAPTQSDAEVRSTKSVIKLRDGETVILGGLIHRDKKVVVKKLPILGDIPLVGMLFRHKNQSKDFERELLVFITPHIIKETPMDLAKTNLPEKKVLPEREQQVSESDIRRQKSIDASLNSFEK